MNEAQIAAIHDSLNPVAEKRRDPRHPGPYRAVVRWADGSGGERKAEGELRDISAGGLYVRLAERVEPGSRFTAEVFINGGAAADFIFSGEVVRSEPLIDLRHGAAVRFDRGRSPAG